MWTFAPKRVLSYGSLAPCRRGCRDQTEPRRIGGLNGAGLCRNGLRSISAGVLAGTDFGRPWWRARGPLGLCRKKRFQTTTICERSHVRFLDPNRDRHLELVVGGGEGHSKVKANVVKEEVQLRRRRSHSSLNRTDRLGPSEVQLLGPLKASFYVFALCHLLMNGTSPP